MLCKFISQTFPSTHTLPQSCTWYTPVSKLNYYRLLYGLPRINNTHWQPPWCVVRDKTCSRNRNAVRKHHGYITFIVYEFNRWMIFRRRFPSWKFVLQFVPLPRLRTLNVNAHRYLWGNLAVCFNILWGIVIHDCSHFRLKYSRFWDAGAESSDLSVWRQRWFLCTNVNAWNIN